MRWRRVTVRRVRPTLRTRSPWVSTRVTSASQVSRCAVAVGISPNRASSAWPWSGMPSRVSNDTVTVARARRASGLAGWSVSMPRVQDVLQGVGGAFAVGTAVVGSPPGAGGGGQGGLEPRGHGGVEHRVQVRQIPDRGDPHRPQPRGADLRLVPVGAVHLGQCLAEHPDLGGPGTGGQLHQRVLVVLQHAQPAGGHVSDDGAQVRRVHDPGCVGGGELGERDQVHRHPRHR